MATPKGSNEGKSLTELAKVIPVTVETPAVVSPAKVKSVFSQEEETAIREIGEKFRRQGWDGSSAKGSFSACVKASSGQLDKVKELDFSRALRHAFSLGQAYDTPESRERYNLMTEAQHGENMLATARLLASGGAVPKLTGAKRINRTGADIRNEK